MLTILQGGPSHRVLAMLRAVAAGRGEVTLSSEPDMRIDGLPCCDQLAAHDLSHAGLIRPASLGVAGGWVPARLTDAGWTLLQEQRPAAA